MIPPPRSGTALASASRSKARAVAPSVLAGHALSFHRSVTPFAEQKARRRCTCPRRSHPALAGTACLRIPCPHANTVPIAVPVATHEPMPSAAARALPVVRNAPARALPVVRTAPIRQLATIGVVAPPLALLSDKRLLGVPLRFAPGRAAPGFASLRPRAAQAARGAFGPCASLTPPLRPATHVSARLRQALPGSAMLRQASLRAPLATSQRGPASPRRMGFGPRPALAVGRCAPGFGRCASSAPGARARPPARAPPQGGLPLAWPSALSRRGAPPQTPRSPRGSRCGCCCPRPGFASVFVRCRARPSRGRPVSSPFGLRAAPAAARSRCARALRESASV